MNRLYAISLQTLLALLILVTAASCASSSKTASSEARVPSWIGQPARTVDGGYIVYTGYGEDRTAALAMRKAESEAFHNLANECTFVPKGARKEDSYQSGSGTDQHAYVKIAVDFSACEEAKSAQTPEQIHRLANVAITEQIKNYEDEIDLEGDPDSLDSDDDGVNPAIASTTAPPRPTTRSPRTVVVIRDEPHWFWVREQLVVEKQTVILAPPAQYPPVAPQTTAVTQRISGASGAIRSYETAHPEVRTAPRTWSTVAKSQNWTRPANHANTHAKKMKVARVDQPRHLKGKRRWHVR